MSSYTQRLEDIYCKEVALFTDLLDCLDSERNNLIDLNLDNLWSLMSRKEKILTTLNKMRDQVQSIREECRKEGTVRPNNNAPPLQELTRKIKSLQSQVKVRVKENVSFIEDNLGFIDEVVSSFTQAGRIEPSYSPNGKNLEKSNPLLYQREV